MELLALQLAQTSYTILIMAIVIPKLVHHRAILAIQLSKKKVQLINACQIENAMKLNHFTLHGEQIQQNIAIQTILLMVLTINI